MLERKFTSTGDQTHNHQVMSPTCSPLRNLEGENNKADWSLGHKEMLPKPEILETGQLAQISKYTADALTFYHTIPTFNYPQDGGLRKHYGKRRKCW